MDSAAKTWWKVAGKQGLKVSLRVLGPEWTRATHVTLYANGTRHSRCRHHDIRRAIPEPAGLKWQATWTIPRPRHDVWLVAIAGGPGR